MDMSEFLMPIDEEEDSRESALCGRKLPLWLGLLLLLAAGALLVPLIYFAVRANSKACVDGLQAQKECQELNRHLQRQLNQPQEVLHEKEAEAATCKQTVVTLKDALKKDQARVEELQGELANLNQQVDDLSEKLSPVPMMDKLEGSMLTRCKLPLWLGLLLLLAVVGLLVPLIYFAVRANSKACVDGLQAQKECQELSQHLQRQLDQASREKEAEAATCNRSVVTLRESLKKEQAQVAKFQGELKILNQTLKDALADVERLSLGYRKAPKQHSPPPALRVPFHR
ncbi:hypothetical protein MJG53_006998 [Ovis ammon polii x Ovis aries]|uniref:Uncharacterized protein n=1 Tax=Ovis ammon polii x Ovis aries TaxID=2918886 RepID=A0ACB9V296_9CETA|nr:hypothetical protein MJG53_006998 [Ovis ammon polii x Ovis aries]